MEQLERADIQGLLFSAYAHLPCAAYLMLRVEAASAARAWLGHLAPEITAATGKQAGISTNIAFTFSGISRLGLDEDALTTFPVAFREGMTSPRRAQILGDDHENAPAGWLWGGRNEVDLLLMLYSDAEHLLDAELERLKAELSGSGLGLLKELRAARMPDQREHFGFVDGVGQPVIEGSGRRKQQFERTRHVTEVKPGEFILGYLNEYGVPADSPSVRASPHAEAVLHPVAGRSGASSGAARLDLGRNGSYLVFRHLSQDVTGFWKYLDAAAAALPAGANLNDAVRLGAKIVGRWPSGAPLVKYPDRDPYPGAEEPHPENDFEYVGTDAFGLACPLGAHIRRANPRDTLGPDPSTALRSTRRHRLLRRGRSYGRRLADPREEDGQERGLFFICLNSDLERQFEFVQQTWINSPVFGGLCGEVDPLVGVEPDNPTGGGVMTIPQDPLRLRIHNLCRFVTIRGGAYFFLPGLRALRYLSRLPG
jgi:Dyp-type peroxidase family